VVLEIFFSAGDGVCYRLVSKPDFNTQPTWVEYVLKEKKVMTGKCPNLELYRGH
jgi:hypothetical protein